MTHTPSGYDITPEMLQRLDGLRQDEMVEAIDMDRHYWVRAVLYRVTSPAAGESDLLDNENLRGFIPVHCAICGTDDLTSTDCLPVEQC